MSHSGQRVHSSQAIGLGAVLLGMALSACVSTPSPSPDMSTLPEPPVDVAPTHRGEFSVAAGMNDTWNAVGQVLVRMDGIVYEGRSQMLGLYDVLYRGERMLIVTRGRVLRGPNDQELTVVTARQRSGALAHSAQAAELMARLEHQIPDELARIAAGERGAVK